MTTEFLALGRRMTVAEALTTLRDWKPDAEEIYDAYVVDRHGRLAGTISMRQLLIEEPAAVLTDVVDTGPRLRAGGHRPGRGGPHHVAL